jgi:hypothetical protein
VLHAPAQLILLEENGEIEKKSNGTKTGEVLVVIVAVAIVFKLI